MPNLEISSLHEKAVLYAKSSFNKFGEQTVSTAVEIDARWELGVALNIDLFSTTKEADGIVWVDRDITNHSLLYQGGKSDLPSPVTDLYEVIDFTKIPDIKGRHPERVCLVRKFNDTLPS